MDESIDQGQHLMVVIDKDFWFVNPCMELVVFSEHLTLDMQAGQNTKNTESLNEIEVQPRHVSPFFLGRMF